MSENYSTSSSSNGKEESFWSRLFKGFVRLVLVALGGGAIGLVAYLAYVFIIRDLVTQPTTEFQQAFSISETRQARSQERFEERLSEYSERIAVLESRHTTDAEMLDELQSDIRALETAIANQSDLLERVEALEDSLQTTLQQQEEMNQQLESGITEIGEVQSTLQAAAGAEGEVSTSELLRELRLLHALELIDRSRLYMLQNNLGLAEQDVLLAKEILLTLQEKAPLNQQTKLEDWIDRLESVANDLPQSPRVAAIDLDIIWDMMILGLDEDWIETTITPLDLPQAGATEEASAVEPTPSQTPTPE